MTNTIRGLLYPIIKYCYVFFIFTGVRSLLNNLIYLIKHHHKMVVGTVVIDGDYYGYKIRKFSKKRTCIEAYFRFSVWKIELRGQFMYEMILLTSHYGDAHIEGGFIVKNDVAMICSFRDIAHANLIRMNQAHRLVRIPMKKKMKILHSVINSHYILNGFISINEILKKEIDLRLVSPHKRDAIIIGIKETYLSGSKHLGDLEK